MIQINVLEQNKNQGIQQAMENEAKQDADQKYKMLKTQIRVSRKRHPLALINELNRDSQLGKNVPAFKRTVSIAGMTRKNSVNYTNKKSQQVLNYLMKMPKKDRHLMTAEIKCFMMSKHVHDSHLIQKRLCIGAIEKIKSNDRFQTLSSISCFSDHFQYSKFVALTDNIINKNGDSLALTQSFEQCVLQKYPVSVHFMLLYFGIFLYTINAQYSRAQAYCQKLFDMIVRFKVEQYFIIYLIMKVKIKTNLSEWEQSLALLTNLVFFSWMYHLSNLEIWCYFQLSRVYFFLQKSKESQIFKLKSELNSVEPKRSIYRQVSISNLILEIQSIWEGQLDFKNQTIIQQTRLTIPQQTQYGVEQYIADQRKLKTNIKNIVQQCKIRYVGNLLGRISDLGMISMMEIQGKDKSNNKISFVSSNSKMKQKQLRFQGSSNEFSRSKQNSLNCSLKNLSGNSSKTNTSGIMTPKSGNNFLLTHKSFNKNMNMFFRRRLAQQNDSQRVFYTIQNSNKNWSVLKQMLRNIYLQMVYFQKQVRL